MPFKRDYGVGDDGHCHEDILQRCQKITHGVSEDPSAKSFDDPQWGCEDANTQVSQADIGNQKIKRCSHIRPTYQSRYHKSVTKKTEKDDQREKQRGKNVKGRTGVICR